MQGSPLVTGLRPCLFLDTRPSIQPGPLSYLLLSEETLFWPTLDLHASWNLFTGLNKFFRLCGKKQKVWAMLLGLVLLGLHALYSSLPRMIYSIPPN